MHKCTQTHKQPLTNTYTPLSLRTHFPPVLGTSRQLWQQTTPLSTAVTQTRQPFLLPPYCLLSTAVQTQPTAPPSFGTLNSTTTTTTTTANTFLLAVPSLAVYFRST